MNNENLTDLNQYLFVKSCVFLIQQLFNNGSCTIKVLFNTQESIARKLDQLDNIKSYCYENGSILGEFIQVLEKNGVVNVVDAEWFYVENFGYCECSLSITNENYELIENLAKKVALKSFSNKYGDIKQLSVTEKLIKSEFRKFDNQIFNIDLWRDNDNCLDPIFALTRLGDDDYLRYELTSIQLGHGSNDQDFREFTCFNDGYSCKLRVVIFPKLIHKWAIEDDLFSDRIRFDVKTGFLWVDKQNYKVVRPQTNQSNISKMLKVLVTNVNSYVSYRDLAKEVYGWSEKELITNYKTKTKDSVRIKLQDIREQIENEITNHELDRILSIEANNGLRLNFCPEYKEPPDLA